MTSVYNPEQMFSGRELLPEKKPRKIAKAEKKKKEKKRELEVCAQLQGNKRSLTSQGKRSAAESNSHGRSQERQQKPTSISTERDERPVAFIKLEDTTQQY